jgi:hypothetical protein
VLDSTDSLIKLLAGIFGVVGGLASVLAAVGSMILGYYFEHKPMPSEATLGGGRGDEIQLREAVRELSRQERVSRWSRWISRVLGTGPWLVVAAIASTLFQATLSERHVGILGMVLFLCHMVQYRFQPDRQGIGAEARVTILRRLIRDAEGHIY